MRPMRCSLQWPWLSSLDGWVSTEAAAGDEWACPPPLCRRQNCPRLPGRPRHGKQTSAAPTCELPRCRKEAAYGQSRWMLGKRPSGLAAVWTAWRTALARVPSLRKRAEAPSASRARLLSFAGELGLSCHPRAAWRCLGVATASHGALSCVANAAWRVVPCVSLHGKPHMPLAAPAHVSPAG